MKRELLFVILPIKFVEHWDKILPSDVLEFHTLLSKQTNAPINLQMGTVLPFVASCVGPKTSGHFLTNSIMFEFILDHSCCIRCR